MNDEEVKNGVSALTGGAADGEPKAETVDWEAKYRHQLEISNADSGRMKQKDSRIAELEKRLAELEKSKTNEDLMSSLSDDERNSIPTEVLGAATKIVSKGMDRIRAEQDQRLKEMEQRNRDDAEARKVETGRRFLANVDARYPGFRRDIGMGGDKHQQWQSYLRYNKGSIDAALAAGDFDAFAYHVDKFYNEHLGVSVPSGYQDGSAATDPANRGGGNGGVGASGKVYTQAEYIGLYDKVEEARNRGDYDEMKRLNAEIQKAPAEGRVK